MAYIENEIPYIFFDKLYIIIFKISILWIFYIKTSANLMYFKYAHMKVRFHGHIFGAYGATKGNMGLYR